MNSSRIDWIDYSKAFLIVLVVFAHCPLIPHVLDVLMGFICLHFSSYQVIYINVRQIAVIAYGKL